MATGKKKVRGREEEEEIEENPRNERIKDINKLLRLDFIWILIQTNPRCKLNNNIYSIYEIVGNSNTG